jgi:hypothetical protein
MTAWRRTQSRANFSPLNSLLTEKNTGNIAPPLQHHGSKSIAMSALAKKTASSQRIGTGNEQGI